MKNVYEIFDQFENASTRQERVDILRKNGNYALRSVLKGTYDPNVKFNITEMPSYKPSNSPPGLGYTSIHQELGRTYLFEANNPRTPPNLTYKRKEQILIQILESLENREAEVYLNMLLKKQKVRGLDVDIIEEAFPGLI